jgi:hypothetical protein
VQDNKATAKILAKNSEPIVHGVLPVGTTAAQKAQALNLKDGCFDALMVPTSIATKLHEELNKTIAQVEKSDDYDWLQNCSAPIAIALMFDYVTTEFEHRQPKKLGLPNTASFMASQERYNEFFPPGECFFIFPATKSGVVLPSPNHNSLLGRSIFFLTGSSVIPALH